MNHETCLRRLGGGWKNDASSDSSALLKVFFREKTCLACSVSNNDAALLGRLHVGLEVATDAVTHRHKGKGFFVKDIAMLHSEFKEPLCEAVVVLLLLNSVVESRMPKVLFTIGNQKGFELK